MTSIKTFRDLVAWQKAKELTKLVYMATRAMPAEERFGLTMQIRRAAVSVPSNIAEGYARQSTADYLKHLRIARGSLAELETQYEIILDLEMLPSSQAITDLVAETDRVLQALIRSIAKIIAQRSK